MASGSSSFPDKNQPLVAFATTAEMSVVMLVVSAVLQRAKVSGRCRPARGSERHQLFALFVQNRTAQCTSCPKSVYFPVFALLAKKAKDGQTL